MYCNRTALDLIITAPYTSKTTSNSAGVSKMPSLDVGLTNQ
jgi:hypothetical protein